MIINSTLVTNVHRLLRLLLTMTLKIPSLLWFSDNSLKANSHKFQRFGLAPGRSSVDFMFKVADQELKQENCIKLLGVSIDDNFNFHEHIACLFQKIKKLVYLTDSNALSLSMPS